MLRRLAGDQLRLDIVGDLSREELAILSYVGATLSNRQIAAASGLPESRVKTLVRLVMRKLRLQNRTGVAVFATANRFVAQAAVPTLAKKSVLQCAISDKSEAEEFKP
jgi:DNA-binding NarL/FixJ family response regulator